MGKKQHPRMATFQGSPILSTLLDIVLLGSINLLHLLLQPHFWKSVRMKLTLSKWGLGSPLGLLKLQSSIAGVKTLRLGVFFISLEKYRCIDVENGLA
jgi:hypothetical protein